jgi:hypothetical protein
MIGDAHFIELKKSSSALFRSSYVQTASIGKAKRNTAPAVFPHSTTTILSKAKTLV